MGTGDRPVGVVLVGAVRAARRGLAASLVCTPLAVTGCAGGPAPDGPETLSQSNAPLYLQDAYAIAHGMATSYATSTTANPDVVAQLIRLDARAALAVRTLQRDPLRSSQREATAEAVSALTDFAAAQTYSTQ